MTEAAKFVLPKPIPRRGDPTSVLQIFHTKLCEILNTGSGRLGSINGQSEVILHFQRILDMDHVKLSDLGTPPDALLSMERKLFRDSIDILSKMDAEFAEKIMTIRIHHGSRGTQMTGSELLRLYYIHLHPNDETELRNAQKSWHNMSWGPYQANKFKPERLAEFWKEFQTRARRLEKLEGIPPNSKLIKLTDLLGKGKCQQLKHHFWEYDQVEFGDELYPKVHCFEHWVKIIDRIVRQEQVEKKNEECSRNPKGKGKDPQIPKDKRKWQQWGPGGVDIGCNPTGWYKR